MLDIYKKIKARERLIIIIKFIGEDLNEGDNFNEEDFKDNIFKIIKLFF